MNPEPDVPYHHKTIDQCRAIGRIGGLRRAGNHRLSRLAQTSTPAAIAPEPERETAREASMLLDAKFPWLKGVWAPPVRRPMEMDAAGARGGLEPFSGTRW